ncbi:MAG: type II toxin-antitoxin system RelE/ParE family toxin [Vulcanimicrobiaceae bacterium]
MQIRWLDDAVGDLQAISDTVARDRPSAAADLIERIVAAVDSLIEFPGRGRPGRVLGTRELIVPPYLVAYRVHGDVLEILRVLHGARRWPEEFG